MTSVDRVCRLVAVDSRLGRIRGPLVFAVSLRLCVSHVELIMMLADADEVLSYFYL